MNKPNITERLVNSGLVNGHPGVPADSTGAPGFDQVHGHVPDDVPDDLAFEREVAAIAAKRTAERFPDALPGYIHPPIREAVRRELLRKGR